MHKIVPGDSTFLGLSNIQYRVLSVNSKVSSTPPEEANPLGVMRNNGVHVWRSCIWSPERP